MRAHWPQPFAAQGAAAGLGFETARVLALHGARVTLAARSQAAADDAVARLRTALGAAGAAAQLSALALDLSSIASVEAGAEQLLATTPKLDILINNAGAASAPCSAQLKLF